MQHQRVEKKQFTIQDTATTQDNEQKEKLPVIQQCVINFVALNVCGVKSKMARVDFTDFVKKYEVICLCETRCDDTDMNYVSECMSDLGYDIIYKNRCSLLNLVVL